MSYGVGPVPGGFANDLSGSLERVPGAVGWRYPVVVRAGLDARYLDLLHHGVADVSPHRLVVEAGHHRLRVQPVSGQRAPLDRFGTLEHRTQIEDHRRYRVAAARTHAQPTTVR